MRQGLKGQETSGSLGAEYNQAFPPNHQEREEIESMNEYESFL